MGDGADAAEDCYEDAWEYNQRNPDDPENVDPYEEYNERFLREVDDPAYWEEEPKIRLVPLTEIGWIASLEKCFPGQSWTRKTLLKEYSSRGYRILAVDKKAYVAVRKWGAKYYISALAADPEYRRKGLANLLMSYLIDEARRTYKEFRFFLHVDVDNEAALRLYHKLGFVVVGHIVDCYGKGYDAFKMALIYE